MTTNSKRGVLAAGILALTPLLAVISPGVAAKSTRPASFSPPSEAMQLTRTITRELPGGQAIVVSRVYEIRIVPEGSGYRVDGLLQDVAVDAPPALASLAALEKARTDSGIFPIRLDDSGLIKAVTTSSPSPSFVQAARLADGMVAKSAISPSEQESAKGFIAQLAASQNSSAWPTDLFRPEPGKHEETRRIPLGNGLEGEVKITMESAPTTDNAMLSSLSRTVVTQLGGTARTSREVWVLAARN